MLTIGELARRAGLRPSALRFYEAEGLIAPSGRTEAGYRLYDPSAAATLRLIQRAQGLGFSLAEIRTLLSAWRDGDLDNAETLATAEGRYLALEQQITELRVQQHELEMFLLDLREGAPDAAQTAFSMLVDRICANPAAELPSRAVLDRLVAANGCLLSGPAARKSLARLRGHHIHIWREENAYRILFVGHDPAVAAALAEIVRLESGCRAHPDLRLELADSDEGRLLIAHGDSAFILARLFLALENETP